jgi:hypothetical protein
MSVETIGEPRAVSVTRFTRLGLNYPTFTYSKQEWIMLPFYRIFYKEFKPKKCLKLGSVLGTFWVILFVFPKPFPVTLQTDDEMKLKYSAPERLFVSAKCRNGGEVIWITFPSLIGDMMHVLAGIACMYVGTNVTYIFKVLAMSAWFLALRRYTWGNGTTYVPMSTSKLPTVKMSTKWLKMSTLTD